MSGCYIYCFVLPNLSNLTCVTIKRKLCTDKKLKSFIEFMSDHRQTILGDIKSSQFDISRMVLFCALHFPVEFFVMLIPFTHHCTDRHHTKHFW